MHRVCSHVFCVRSYANLRCHLKRLDSTLHSQFRRPPFPCRQLRPSPINHIKQQHPYPRIFVQAFVIPSHTRSCVSLRIHIMSLVSHIPSLHSVVGSVIVSRIVSSLCGFIWGFLSLEEIRRGGLWDPVMCIRIHACIQKSKVEELFSWDIGLA